MRRKFACAVLTSMLAAITVGLQPCAVKAASPESTPVGEWRMTAGGPQENGLHVPTGSDGVTSSTKIGDSLCMASPGQPYMYVIADDSAKPRAGIPAYVEVEYFDSRSSYTPTQHLQLQYNSNQGSGIVSNYRMAEVAAGGEFAGADTWRTAVFELAYPNFGHRENLGADLRLGTTLEHFPNLFIRAIRIYATRPAIWAKLADYSPKVLLSTSVMQFGAKGDGIADDTKAFQAAMDSLYPTGGIVNVPSGSFNIAGHLAVPNCVTLQGVWTAPASTAAITTSTGTTLLVTEGAGHADGTPFITLNENSTVKGLVVYYPKQYPENITAYPWCIASNLCNNPTVEDCLLVNPYQAIDFGTKPAQRHYIRNVYGQPLFRGIYIDGCMDIGRIENIHFWPFWSGSTGVKEFQHAKAEAFILGRADWQFMLNTFCADYHIGYHFIQTPLGACNGNFLGLACDLSEISLQVDASQPWGLLFSNGEFVACVGTKRTQVIVSPTNTGVVQFANCAFWGSNQVADIDGKGRVTFNTCTFRRWDPANPAIACRGGRLTVSSCNFTLDAPQMQLSGSAGPTLFFGNQLAGDVRIDNPQHLSLEQALNAIGPDPVPGI